jgi:SAM-dependent methyltransferase
VVGGVVDFLPDVERKRSLAQRLMEFERIASIYESRWWRGHRGFAWFAGISLKQESSLIDGILDIRPDEGVLDLACGPGLYARRFAREGAARFVVGLDLSWPMLRRGVATSEREGISNIAFVCGDAHHLPFVEGSMDVANCCAAMHLFPNARRALEELHRVVKPGGRISTAVVLRGGVRLPSRLGQVFAQRIGVRGFREQEFVALLDGAGFDPTVYHARGVWMIAGGVRRN